MLPDLASPKAYAGRITKVLIANRGEIACRVIRTCRKLGIATVAVYSDADKDALHVSMADEAVNIGPPAAKDSYLLADKIVDAAKKTGAQAVHPGYGFLSENEGFARACADAGLTFVGPPPAAIKAMGLKGTAKAHVAGIGIPVLPGYAGDDQAPERLLAEAEVIGWPVLIKAVAGGGGRGMRRVDSAAAFGAALASAKREAAASFGNDKVLIEKLITVPRHIEIQVLADHSGNVVHLFERDCSIQRRHQKVIEEAPAPGLSDAVRRAMGQAAVKVAASIGYIGAGTIEFIVDAGGPLTESSFYFMEMNTRLQVEHGITEAITGYDLVELQLRIASGEKLPFTQADLRIDGHAMEARICAENPAKNFLPSAGKLNDVKFPRNDRDLRVDTFVQSGTEITPWYDSLVGKVIVWGKSREEARSRLIAALGKCELTGITTTAAFLASVAGHQEFAKGNVDTAFLEKFKSDLTA